MTSIHGSRTALLFALLLSLSGCTGNTRTNADPQPQRRQDIVVTVTNRTDTDMEIYAVPAIGVTQWVGHVFRNSTSALDMPAIANGSNTWFVATLAGTEASVRTNALTMQPGDRIDFTVLGPLARSVATITR